MSDNTLETLPKEPFKNIAISLSGGGYKAAAFHLGTFAYLHRLQFEGGNLLENVRVLSTVSGGSFTGIGYIMSLIDQKNFSEFFQEFYTFMTEVDLVGEGLKTLENSKTQAAHKSKTLINAYATIYRKKFTDQDFGVLWEEAQAIHVKDIIVNATEFDNGASFRFQKTKGIVGNGYYQIPVALAKKLKLADILAASSCFPAGFEPINFPNDFISKEDFDELKKNKQTGKVSWEDPIGLMDGGIVDNQGIDAVFLAQNRMMKKTEEKEIGLYIVSDVSDPYMKDFVATKENKLNWWRKLNFIKLRNISMLSLLLCLLSFAGIGLIPAHKLHVALLSVLGTLFFVVGGAIYFFYDLFIKRLPKQLQIPPFFAEKLAYSLKMRFGVYETMLLNRISSVLSMVWEVFMLQIRRQFYDKIYRSATWRNKTFMNGIYELTPREAKKKKKRYTGERKVLNPSEKIQSIAALADSMATTLWFTPEDLQGDKNKPDSLVATGQFTICFNLLEYTFVLKAKKEYENYPQEIKDQIEALQQSLLEDWKAFNKDPFWLFES